MRTKHSLIIGAFLLFVTSVVSAVTYAPTRIAGGAWTTPSSSWGGPDGSSGIYERGDAGITYHKGNNTEVVLSASGGGGGTVTSVTASAPLTGGTITTSGSIGLGTTGPGAGSYGGAGSMVAIAGLDAYGRVTSITTGGIASTGGVAVGASGNNFTVGLPTQGPGAGSYCGTAQYLNAVTIDAYGKISALTCGTPAGGGSTGNFTFSGNVMDLSASGAMSVGSTNTTSVALSVQGGAATITAKQDSSFGVGYYDLILSTGVFSLFNATRDGPSISSGQIFEYIGGSAVTSLTGTRFQPTTAGGLNLGSDSVPWAETFVYAHATKLGSQITAAASITPTTGLHHLTGATSVTTIVATNFPGNWTLTLVCDVATCNYGTGGNIALAGTISQNHAARFQYDATASLWFPQ